jgi:addiction module RelB/DinJ family antitoxin
MESVMNAMVTARVPAEIKKQATELFGNLGTSPSEAINQLYSYVVARGALPEFVQPGRDQTPAPAVRRNLNKETLTPEQRQRLLAIRLVRDMAIEDWGADEGKSYRQIIEEGKRAKYEALSGKQYAIRNYFAKAAYC